MSCPRDATLHSADSICHASLARRERHGLARAQRTMSRILQVQVDYFRVDVEGGFSMPRMIMRDRRNQRNSARPVHWVFQRHLEMILYNRWDGGTSGAVYKLLHATGLNRTSFNIGKAQVQAKEVTQGEFSELVGVALWPCRRCRRWRSEVLNGWTRLRVPPRESLIPVNTTI